MLFYALYAVAGRGEVMLSDSSSRTRSLLVARIRLNIGSSRVKSECIPHSEPVGPRDVLVGNKEQLFREGYAAIRLQSYLTRLEWRWKRAPELANKCLSEQNWKRAETTKVLLG